MTASPEKAPVDPLQFTNGTVTNQILKDIAEDYDSVAIVVSEIYNFLKVSTESSETITNEFEKLCDNWGIANVNWGVLILD